MSRQLQSIIVTYWLHIHLCSVVHGMFTFYFIEQHYTWYTSGSWKNVVVCEHNFKPSRTVNTLSSVYFLRVSVYILFKVLILSHWNIHSVVWFYLIIRLCFEINISLGHQQYNARLVVKKKGFSSNDLNYNKIFSWLG